MEYKRILVAVDLNRDTIAVLERFQDFDGAVCVITTVPDIRPFHSGDPTELRRFESDLLDSAEERLLSRCRRAGLAHAATHVTVGDLDDVVIRKAREQGAGLVAFANDNPEGFEHIIGGHELAMLHKADCDLLAVHSPSKGDFAHPVVALTIDGHQEAVLRGARRLCPEVNLDILHVIRNPQVDYNFEWSHADGFQGDELMDSVRVELGDLPDRYGPSALHFTRGKPSTGLLGWVDDHNNDLIVISSGIHKGIGWRLGSTAHNVLAAANCDVLVVRPERV